MREGGGRKVGEQSGKVKRASIDFEVLKLQCSIFYKFTVHHTIIVTLPVSSSSLSAPLYSDQKFLQTCSGSGPSDTFIWGVQL